MPALELKGRMASLTRLRLLDPDLDKVRAHLEDMARRVPDAVRGMPVVVEADFLPDLGAVCALLRRVGMQPLAVAEGMLAESGRAIGLAVLPDESRTRAKPAAAPAGRKPARIVDTPVRSGQQIYADNRDLTVLTTVGAGAEVIADGSVHIYGPLRGRALAGAQGNEKARIFCREFHAELVAIAGHYKVLEDIPKELRGKAVQIWLEDEQIKIAALD